jgi:hypothetical protein
MPAGPVAAIVGDLSHNETIQGVTMSYLPIAADIARTAVEKQIRREVPARRARRPGRRVRFAAARSLRRAAERLEPGTSRA